MEPSPIDGQGTGMLDGNGRGGEPPRHMPPGGAPGPDLWDVWTVSQVQAYSIMILTTFVCFYLLIKLCRKCMRSIFHDEQAMMACDNYQSSSKAQSRVPNGRRQNSLSTGAPPNPSITEQNSRLIQ